MNYTNLKRCQQVLVSSLVALAAATTVFAGGFQLVVEAPSGSSDPELKKAALLVRTFGCHQPENASVLARAEGLVKGQRRTLPLELKPTSKGVYAISQQWPSEGVWLVAVEGNYQGFHSSVLTQLRPGARMTASKNGDWKLSSRTLNRKFSVKEIEDSLQMMASHQQAAK